MVKVMAMGTFDIIHPGHLFFLTEAKRYGDHFVVLVSRDETVKKVKGKPAHFNEMERYGQVKATGIPDKVILGNLGDKYKVFADEKPDVICLGYDQKAFTDNMKEKLAEMGLNPRIVRIAAFKPEIHKSSKLRDKLNK